MATRRSHQKSRHGCTTCKRRRVKCDEHRPVCNNCSQRNDTCVYSAPVPYFFPEGSRKPPTKGSNTRKGLKDSHTPDGSICDVEGYLSGPETSESLPSLNMDHLELELQWIMHTHKLFARSEETRKVWEISVLQEALRSPFLMHGILALSALHLSHLHQDDRQTEWLNIAIAHKSSALSKFSGQLKSITELNAKAMMSFAGLAVAFSFASALNCFNPEDGPSLGALTDVFVLSRGVQIVFNQAGDFLRESNFAPLFNIASPDIVIPDHVILAFDLLSNLNNQCKKHSPENVSSAYGLAIQRLRELASFSYAEPTSLTLAAGWAIRCPADYLDELKARKPLALVVLAHYCALLHLARENWCVGPWGRVVLEEIQTILDGGWQIHIEWALNQVAE
ncbi:hypothetical protein N7462_008590 [Penicillium macrosclerotiorum]|uniref:uncharacterized protein n=1 Tax=Penicillium macrosclerotiorum TaxID=303699 RepID=UPI002548C4B8|nr:uncharacterized protein N7462_008590 [Penicillium macrosclerotiorum]KAJ5675693.1 hypothetical protein N7462_008590 [Penicillium macrosclerotiorum]